MKNRLLFLLGGMLAFGAVGAGQEQEKRPNGFYLTSPLGLSSGYDDNFVVNGRALDDTVSILTGPTAAWTGCSAALCSGSSPVPTTAFTEWATETCCSRSRALRTSK